MGRKKHPPDPNHLHIVHGSGYYGLTRSKKPQKTNTQGGLGVGGVSWKVRNWGVGFCSTTTHTTVIWCGGCLHPRETHTPPPPAGKKQTLCDTRGGNRNPEYDQKETKRRGLPFFPQTQKNPRRGHPKKHPIRTPTPHHPPPDKQGGFVKQLVTICKSPTQAV